MGLIAAMGKLCGFSGNINNAMGAGVIVKPYVKSIDMRLICVLCRVSKLE